MARIFSDLNVSVGQAGKLFGIILMVLCFFCFNVNYVNGLVFKSGSVSPKLSIVGDYAFLQKIECRHGNSTDNLSLSIIRCSSASNCDKKFPCLLNNLMCSARDRILRGGVCASNIFTDHGQHVNNCLALDPDHQSSGLIQCTSTDSAQPQRTLDYFFQGLDYKLYMLSNASTLPKSAIFELKVEKYSHKFKMDPLEDKESTLYTNEEIDFSCAAAEFIYNKTTLEMTIRKKDGTIFEINPSSLFSYSYNDVYRIILKRFRMSKDMAEVSCSVKGRDDSPLSRTVTHEIKKFTTIDPPLRLAAKTFNGKLRKFDLNQTLGCTYNGTASERNQLNSKLFSTLDYQEVNFIKSIIDFLRFVQFAQGNYSCIVLNDKNLTSDNSLEDFDYYVKVVQRLPSIEKPGGQQSLTLKGHDYRSLSCRHTGIPRPYVIWFRNNEKFLHKVQTLRERNLGFVADEDDVEESLLVLPPMKSSEKLVNYTCVAYNHLGQDSFNYLIVEDDQPVTLSVEQNAEFNIWIVISILFGTTSLVLAITFFVFRTKYMENMNKLQNPNGSPVQMQFNNATTLGGHQQSANLDYEVLQEDY